MSPELSGREWSEVIQAAADAVLIIDRRGSIHYANAAAADLFGYTNDDLVGLPYHELVPEDVRAAHAEHHRGFVESPAVRRMGRGLSLRARRADGSLIDVDIALVPLVGEELRVAVFVRDVSATVRLVARLSAATALFRSALAGAERDELAHIAVDQMRAVVGGDTCWLGSRSASGSVTVDIATGADAERWRAEPFAVLAGADDAVVAETASSTGLPGSLLLVPVGGNSGTETEVVGGRPVLGAHRRCGREFRDAELEAARSFADTWAVVSELVELRRLTADLATMADHDRIARDLHDSVIQRLFGTAMRLEAIVPAADGVIADRVGEAVDELDEAMQELRAAIFELRRPVVGRSGVRGGVVDEVRRFVDPLGFEPGLSFRGALDEELADEVAAAIPVVVREACSNIARHARATRARVTVELDGDDVVVSVADDGIGPPPDAEASGGLANMRERAEALGGSWWFGVGDLGGAELRWKVPTRGRPTGLDVGHDPVSSESRASPRSAR